MGRPRLHAAQRQPGPPRCRVISGAKPCIDWLIFMEKRPRHLSGGRGEPEPLLRPA
jgi:hypothetical protein